MEKISSWACGGSFGHSDHFEPYIPQLVRTPRLYERKNVHPFRIQQVRCCKDR
ncbi:uncharacterized protein METZ01_LOCUS74895 [marine metagenome]|uniref:Uncharacterized protein n=1 Tax=marine metagenome TaxID=408172 RepID=A0A381U2P9_9ZZZZ